MNLTVKQLNRFIIFKLPSAYLCGVKVLTLNDAVCVAGVKFRWINQNPFKSIYFAVLAMAAELSTGALVLKKTQETKHKFSTLVVGVHASFYKKAVGKVTFVCEEAELIEKHVRKALLTKEGESFVLTAKGFNAAQEQIAVFTFTWSIKLKATLN